MKWSVTGTGANPANAADFGATVLPSGTLTFQPGQTKQSITLNVAADTVVKPNQSFVVTLSAPSGASLATASAAGLIINPYTPPPPPAVLAIAPLDATQPEGAAGHLTAFTFTVTQSGNTAVAVTANYAVAGSGAHPAGAAEFAGGAYPSGTVTFAAGQTSKTITVEVAGNATPQPNLGFSVTLSNASNGGKIATGSAAGLIINDDASHRGGVVLPSGLEVYAAPGSGEQSQLWSTDEVSSTQLTAVINRSGGLNPMNFITLANGKEVFSGLDNSGHSQLWGTDGVTAHAFTTVSNSAGGLNPYDFIRLTNGLEVFAGLDSQGHSQLWGTDGVTAHAFTSISNSFGAPTASQPLR